MFDVRQRSLNSQNISELFEKKLLCPDEVEDAVRATLLSAFPGRKLTSLDRDCAS